VVEDEVSAMVIRVGMPWWIFSSEDEAASDARVEREVQVVWTHVAEAT
jgi:hypothetical protein